jgi:hypothetical protein
LRLLIRWLRRFAVLGLGIVGVWFIVFVLRITDRRLPTILALSLTYAIAAYVILPRVVRMGLKILQRKSVPSFTLTGDGLPGDPVNLALIGEFERLRAAFARAGWIEADPLNLRSSWGMAVAFVLNRPSIASAIAACSPVSFEPTTLRALVICWPPHSLRLFARQFNDASDHPRL